MSSERITRSQLVELTDLKEDFAKIKIIRSGTVNSDMTDIQDVEVDRVDLVLPLVETPFGPTETTLPMHPKAVSTLIKLLQKTIEEMEN